MDVGFIGTGSMGLAMVPNLIKAGHRVAAWNRHPEALRALADVEALAAPADAFQRDAVITMLSDDKAVRAVILDGGVLAGARRDCVHVMTATISPALVEELKAAHAAAGVRYVSAPVFGVPAAAAAAQLNILAAGDPAAIAAVQPLFDVLGQKTWRLGDDPVRANVAKIAGNLMITYAIEAMGEAGALAESHGLPAADFLDVVTNTIMSSPIYKRYGGFIAQRRFDPGFKLVLGLKDVDLALDAARASGAALPTARIVREHMMAAMDQGLADRDWSVLATMVPRPVPPAR